MATVIRAELSRKNKYWIDKHRHYELKHFCLQYPTWKKTYSLLSDSNISLSSIDHLPSSNHRPSDRTAQRAIMKVYYKTRIDLVEDSAKAADRYLYDYIIKAVTEGLSYTYLKTKMGIPCSKDMFYDRYRKFFHILNQTRD